MSLQCISPIDGRYSNKIAELSEFFSEHGLFKYRIQVEVLYLLELIHTPELNSPQISKEQEKVILEIAEKYSIKDSERIKEIEKITRHDVKAVEYFLREKIVEMGLPNLREIIHFGLTSQDINNTSTPMMMRDATKRILIPQFTQLIQQILSIANEYRNVSMLARTHGQPASPTGLGKELAVFAERLQKQLLQLDSLEYSGKFGGATGNFNAHKTAYPQLDWRAWADHFLQQRLGIQRQTLTTQIAHYDEIAEWCHILIRINTILVDFCRDLWTYISMDYFSQKTVAGEVGSSAMPHKVNPIDFENAEGNFGMANAIFSFMAEKLPISRLQRDLTDSTVLRNLGTPVAHSLIALKSLSFGLTKLEVNLYKIENELNQQWIILAEAVQTILRRENIEHPYELLKNLTRGKTAISSEDLHTFMDGLPVSDAVRVELKSLSPERYIGYAGEF